MNHLRQVFWIFLFLLIGNAVSALIGRFIPGSVLGMLLLFIALALKIIKPHQVHDASEFLTKNMGLFFVPAGVGLMKQFGIIQEYWVVIVVTMVVSTAIVLLGVGVMQQRFEARRNKDIAKEENV